MRRRQVSHRRGCARARAVRWRRRHRAWRQATEQNLASARRWLASGRAQCLQRRVSMLAFSVTAERDSNVTDLRDGYNTLAVVYGFADGAKTQIIGAQ